MRLLNMLSGFALFNVLVFVGGGILAGYTGDLLLNGEVLPGETFESEFLVNDIKDMTFIFSATKSLTSLTEQLNINIIEPNGNSSYWMTSFYIPQENEDEPSTESTTIIKKTRTTGKYHIKITGAKTSTYIKIKTGMINVEPLSAIAWLVFWIIVMVFSSKYLGGIVILSNEESIISLFLSLVINYYAIYYFAV